MAKQKKKHVKKKQKLNVIEIIKMILSFWIIGCFCSFIYFLFHRAWSDTVFSFITFFISLIIFGVLFPDDKTKAQRSRNHAISQMSGDEFEFYCASLLSKNGFHRVTVTPASNDYGADIIAYDKNNQKWVFQCKRYSGKVGNTSVQEAVTAKAHYNANYAAVMTNSRLTDNARLLAIENNVELFEDIR